MNLENLNYFVTKVYDAVNHSTTFYQGADMHSDYARDTKAINVLDDLRFFLKYNSQHISKKHLDKLNHFMDISKSKIYLMSELRFNRFNFLNEKTIPRQDYCTLNRRQEWYSLNEYVENDLLKLKNSLIS